MENMDFVKWKDVTITGGFWKDVCEVNRNQTIPHIYRMFQENGYLDAYQLNWYPGKKVPHAFWDSEVAKWIEAVCYELGNRKDDALRRMLDETVGLCRMAQEEDGYLTIHFQSVEPELRWRNLRDSHEMYTAGHYIEAGVAYAQSGLGEELLKMAVQIAEHVWKRYGGQKQKPWKYGGHPELEYAMMRLYHCTGDERWKEFAGELIAMRGDPPLYFPIEEKERKRDHLCSKLENGKVELSSDVFCLVDLLDSCSTIIGGQAASQNVKLVTDFAELKQMPHTYFKGSPLHIKQIIINIAGNAVKYNKPQGTVNFRCYKVSEENETANICFDISDTGIGMSREYLEHIFEPFTQEQDGARTHYQGTGLGMTITKRLVDKMGGSIQIESELDLGSRFTVVLPLETVETSENQEENLETQDADITGKKILLVEDNELNQEIAAYMLQERGLEVTVAVNGKEAVELFEQSNPDTFDLIFMDVMMPQMNGYEATRAIRELDRPDAVSVPIIAMTANAYAEDVREAKEAGMNEHMAKPLDPEVINRILTQWLG